MKKIFLIFSVLIVFSLPLQFQQMQTADAALASKVASTAAKKVAKIPIKDITKDIAFEMAQQAIAQNFNEKSTYKFEEGYEGYCVTEIKSDGSCSKIMQIKKDLTTTDISKIDGQVETEMDKAITGGKGFPKWQKFLDWFVPIWLVSAGVTAITYAFDSDVKSLFNEIGYNTLVSLGLIKPVETDLVKPIEEVNAPVPIPEAEGKLVTGDGTAQNVFAKKSKYGTQFAVHVDNYPIDSTLVEFAVSSPPEKLEMAVMTDNVSYNVFAIFALSQFTISFDRFSSIHTGVGKTVTTKKDGVILEQKTSVGDSTLLPIFDEQIKTVKTRLPSKNAGFYYTDIEIGMVSGEKYQVQIATTAYRGKEVMQIAYASAFYPTDTSSYVSGHITARKNVPLNVVVPVVPYENYEEEGKEPIGGSKYSKGENIALVPPAAVPIREVGTGENVIRKPSESINEEPIYQKPDGTIVPPDNVEVGDPVVIPSTPDQTDSGGKPIPENTPVVTPTPTPENPTPAPIPVVPSTPVVPDEDGTPIFPPDEPPTKPDEPIPDGPACEEKFKLPIFSPLKEQLSTSFPFSIPWDIERAAHAAFDGVGNEKPSFDLVIPVFGGETHTVKIGTPSFMDDWKPFMDGVLLLTFDLLLMFGLYRFVKGAGS